MGTGLKIIINGVDLSKKLSGYKLSYVDKKKVTETADGRTHMYYLTTKSSIELTCLMLDNNELQQIISVIKINKINYIEYYDCNKSFDIENRRNSTGYFFVDSRNVSVALVEEDKLYWQDFALTFVEQ